jgi:hypothetical protein
MTLVLATSLPASSAELERVRAAAQAQGASVPQLVRERVLAPTGRSSTEPDRSSRCGLVAAESGAR